MKKLMIVAAMFALAACVSHGQKFEMSDVDAMQPGVTTYDEAVAKLGKPKSQHFAKDGTKIVTWVYARAGGFTSEVKGTGMIFDQDGKLVRITSKSE